MKKISLVLLIFVLLIVQIFAVSALSVGEAKGEWQEAKEISREAQAVHREAKATWAGDKTDENDQAVVETGKEALHAALNEVEAWLIWKNLEAEENSDVPGDLKDAINDDVEINLAKIEGLRADVDGVDNQLGLGLVFLKMVGQYWELLTDVARNSGAMWTHIGEQKAETIADYEEKLREAAGDNEAVLEKLDAAKKELGIAERNLENAQDTYGQVRKGGTPLLKFGEGNNYLRAARNNLIAAHGYLNQAYLIMVAEGQ